MKRHHRADKLEICFINILNVMHETSNVSVPSHNVIEDYSNIGNNDVETELFLY